MRVFIRQPVIAWGIACLAVLSLNGWLLALITNRRLFLHGGSISELSVRGQPDARLFLALGIISGILFMLFGALIHEFVPRRTRGLPVLVFGSLAFGLATVVDSLMVLPCSETLDKNCVIPVVINPSRYEVPAHAYSSLLIAVLYLVLPLAGAWYARSIKNRGLEVASWVAILTAIASMISALWEYATLRSINVRASGLAQGVQILVLSAWFIYLFYAINHSVAKNRD